MDVTIGEVKAPIGEGRGVVHIFHEVKRPILRQHGVVRSPLIDVDGCQIAVRGADKGFLHDRFRAQGFPR